MDPSGGSGIGKAAGELLKEVEEASKELKKLDKAGSGGASFESVMQSHAPQATDPVSNTQQVSESGRVLLQAKVNANLPTTKVGQTAAIQRTRLAKMLDGLIGGQDKMNQLMRMALSGRQFSHQELLAMQAGVYRFSQELELTSKVIEKATGGIKQTMNTQV